MKTKLFLFFVFCMVALTMQAQKCVVLNFQVGSNVTEEEVEAVSYEFRSNFNPSCYTIEEPFKVNRVLSDLGFNTSVINKEQIRKLGRNLVAAVVVYGSLSKFMDEYTLDVNVMDVSTGTTLANQNNTFQKSEYRTHTRSVSQGVVTKLCNPSSSTSSTSSGSASVSTTTAKAPVPEGYTDLGLPSGTLWKATNESGFYDYNTAMSKYAGQLPTQEQWSELKDYCTWKWTGSGYIVTSENGNSIVLPALGYRNCVGEVHIVGWGGLYLSSTSEYLSFSPYEVGIYDDGSRHCTGYSVRLVYGK